MLLVDSEIREWCKVHEKFHARSPMIDPFSEAVSGDGVISYGLTSAGYDLRLADDEILRMIDSGEASDPKRFNAEGYKDRMFQRIPTWHTRQDRTAFTLPPQTWALGRTHEYLRIPRSLKARLTGKSTYARSMVLVHATPLEPGWEGHLTFLIGNVGPCPAVVHVMEGIAQIEFEALSRDPEKSYADKGGKYQGQTGVTPARVL